MLIQEKIDIEVRYLSIFHESITAARMEYGYYVTNILVTIIKSQSRKQGVALVFNIEYARDLHVMRSICK